MRCLEGGVSEGLGLVFGPVFGPVRESSPCLNHPTPLSQMTSFGEG